MKRRKGVDAETPHRIKYKVLVRSSYEDGNAGDVCTMSPAYFVADSHIVQSEHQRRAAHYERVHRMRKQSAPLPLGQRTPLTVNVGTW